VTILTKNLIPGNPGGTIPGSPGEAPQPAYCVQTVETVQGTQILFLANDNPPPAYVEIPVSTGPQTVITETCYPASSGVPPGAPTVVPPTATNFEIGWNASAISIASLAADGRYEVTPAIDAVGIVTGITPAPQGPGYLNITHGIYFASGTYQYMENGVPLTPATVFTAGDVFTIRRLGTGIAYFRNTTLDYTSLQPSVGTVWAQASMYFGGDRILNAVIDNTEPPASMDGVGQVGTFDPHPPAGSSPPPQLPGTTPQYTSVAGVMGPIVGYAGDQQGVGSNGPPPYTQCPPDSNGDWPGRSGGQLRQIVGSSSGNPNVAVVAGVLGGPVATIYSGGAAASYSIVAGTLGSIQGSSGGAFLTPNYALLAGVIQGIQGFAIGQGGNVGSVAGVLAGPVAFAGNQQGIGSNGPTPNPPDSNGDWIGRSGGQLRSIVATIYDSTAMLTNGNVIAQHGGRYEFLGIGHWSTLLDSDGDQAPGYGIFGKHHGGYGFAGQGHAVSEGTLPVGTFTGSASQPNIGSMVAVGAPGTFIGLGHFNNVAAMQGILRGKYAVSARGHAVAAGLLPSGSFVGSGSVLNVGRMVGSYSRGTFLGSGTWTNVGSMIGVGQALVIMPSAVMIGAMGRGDFLALGHWDIAALYEAYAFTLRFQDQSQSTPPQVLASHYTNYPFDRILRWGTHYYGVAKDGLYLLEGPQFGTAPIVATVTGAETDLGVPNLKRARSIFVDGVLGQDATFTVTTDESNTVAYAYRQGVRPGTGAHRYKLGRGMRGTYFSFGFSNAAGLPFRIKALAPEVDVLIRTL
jgi:hypothetical protein